MISHTIHERLSRVAGEQGDAPAIQNELGNSLSHQDLVDQIEYTVAQLNRCGVSLNERVAIVLPQSPELAVAFLAVSAAATAAPLNHNYKKKDFLFYLEDLQARVLIVKSGDETSAREAAEALGVPVLELTSCAAGNGGFELTGKAQALSGTGGYAEAGDIALVLHTSGTTSKPKIVPLTHANLCVSADNIVKTTSLTSDDCCLNVMPLFHIHGLVACVLASLFGGGHTVCTAGFAADQFYGWLNELKPSWYSAVPTMHQAILARVMCTGKVGHEILSK